MSPPVNNGGANRGTVLTVLSKLGFSTIAEAETDDGWQRVLLMSPDSTVIETVILPRIVPRRALFRLSHKYGVSMHFFFHPEMTPEPGESVH